MTTFNLNLKQSSDKLKTIISLIIIVTFSFACELTHNERCLFYFSRQRFDFHAKLTKLLV